MFAVVRSRRLRRKDLDPDCTVVSVTQAGGHRGSKCILGTTKTGERRSVTIPPHIRQDVKDHLAIYVEDDPDALLFKPARGGCHLNDRVFNKDVFQRPRRTLAARTCQRMIFAGSQAQRMLRWQR
jgi:integrase